MGWGGRVLTPFGHSLMISHKKIYEQDVGSDIETCFRILCFDEQLDGLDLEHEF